MACLSWACSTSRSTEKETPQEREPRIAQGIITASLHRYIESSATDPFERFSLTASFPRYKRSAKPLVDSLSEGDVPELYAPLDQCLPPAPAPNRAPRRIAAAAGTAVELVDVGDISVESEGLTVTLPTQTFPDLLRAIDGVTYSGNDQMGVIFSPAATYTIHAGGTDAVSRFEVVLDAPEDLGEIAVGGVSPAEQPPVVRRGEPLRITWEGGGGYGDEAFARLSWTDMGLPWALECRMRDDGAFDIPGEMLEGIRDPLSAADAEMTISRVRQTAFRASGLDSGEFSFVLSTSFLVRLESVP